MGFLLSPGPIGAGILLHTWIDMQTAQAID
jgi:hypothetical protein